MNAHKTTQNQARQIFEAGDSFAKCCEAAAGEFCRRQSCEAKANRWNRFRPIADGEENPGANATRLAEDEDENAGGDSDSGVINSEATRKETIAEVSARVLREFCDRLGTAHERYPEIFCGEPM
jgi:hypothetical protein